MASLEDRISKPQEGQTAGDAEASTGTNTAKPTSAAGEIGSWADETSATDTNSRPSTVEAKAEKEMSSLSKAQTDGASSEQRGTSGIYEPSYEVDVQLSDLQKDSGNPLHSIKSFEELGL